MRALSIARLRQFCVLAPFTWFVLVLWIEWYLPGRAISKCRWPDVDGDSQGHVAVMADPQLVDDHTYPGRPRALLWLTRVVTDRHLARNWRFMHARLEPDQAFFVGDLFDGGREWKDQAWNDELLRFRTIFNVHENATETVHFNLPGNHDIGFGNSIVKRTPKRFARAFGKPNDEFNFADSHVIVTLDTISLSNTDDEAISKPAETFMNTFSSSKRVVLLTHVPLSRPLDSPCGPKREGKTLAWTQGFQYVTEISPELTKKILQSMRPVMIFSGDDHDACEYEHNYRLVSGGERKAPEYTVKSISMAMGIRWPGFELLTLGKNSESARICLTADPFSPFVLMGGAAIVTLVLCFRRQWSRNRRTHNSEDVELADNPTYKAEAAELAKPSSSRSLRAMGKDVLICALGWFLGEVVVTRWIYAPLPLPASLQ